MSRKGKALSDSPSLDTSERKRAEEALRESEKKFRTFMETATDLMHIADKDGNLTYVNESTARTLGYSKEEMIGKHVTQFLGKKTLEEDFKPKWEELITKGEIAVEATWVTKDGKEIFGEQRVVATYDSNGNYAGSRAVFRDLTERKQAEEALQESEQNFRALAENSADAIMIFPIDRTLLYANRRAPEMTGYGADELLHTTIKDLAPPQTFNEIMEKHQKRYKGKTSPQQYEGALVRKDGESVKTEITATTTIWKGQPASMVVFRDLTERKQMERARVEQAAAIARAEEVQQSRQRIMSMQESLRKDIAQQIHGSVQNRLIVLLHQLTELERVASPGEVATELGDVRQKLEGVLENQVRPISHRLYPAILRRGLIAALQSLEDQCEALPAIKMELDEELMRRERFEPRLIPEQVRLAAYRIVEESLTNIIKHAKASKVTIGLELSSNGWLHLTVWDNGQGFNVGRASNGLGILMIHDYAEVVGGRCVIRSAPGKGIEVTATLPLSGPGAEQLERASPLE